MISFSGNLEHLPIVDVMQLLHQTRKSGVLRVRGRKGESRLVFKDGSMVSANHLNNSVRIGQILVDLKIITPELLCQALLLQGHAGPRRKPLIITLIELGYVNEKDAYKGLERLIEMAVVEILTWRKGTFSLEVLPTPADDFTFYPGRLLREINVDTQSVLLEAMRIYDEKRRDGALTDEEQQAEVAARGPGAAVGSKGEDARPAGRLQEPEMPRPSAVSPAWSDSSFHVEKPVAVRSTNMISVCPVCRYSAFRGEPFAICPQCGERVLAPDPQVVGYIGRGGSALGVALLLYGLYGLAGYYNNEWQAVISAEGLEQVSRAGIFFRFGFLPWLFTLFGGLFIIVARRFLMLRGNPRKEMKMAAWTGVAVCAAYEADKFITWIREASSPSLSYYAVGLCDSLLKAGLFSLPFLALLWYLKSKSMVRAFP